MMKKSRVIRKVVGKDPVLSIEAFEKWKSSEHGIVDISVTHRIMKVVCEHTIESVKNGGSPIRWAEVIERSGIHRSTSYPYLKELIDDGFIEVLRVTTRGRYLSSTKKALELYLDSLEKLYEAMGDYKL